jgi:hypothetical protein
VTPFGIRWALHTSRAILSIAIFILNASTVAQTAGNALSLGGTNYFRTTLWSGYQGEIESKLFDSKSFTFEFWFNALKPGVLLNEMDTSPDGGWDYAFAEVFSDGLLKIGALNVPTTSAGMISFGSWNHLALVYNEADQTLSAYLNGLLTASSVGNRGTPNESTGPSRSAFYAFGRGGATNLGGGGWFSGKFDEVRIWRVALDATQILKNRGQNISPTTPGLVTLWHCDIAGPFGTPDSAIEARNHAVFYRSPALVASSAPMIGVATKSGRATGYSALLEATAYAQGRPMTAYFQWGESTYDKSTIPKEIGNTKGGLFRLALRCRCRDLSFSSRRDKRWLHVLRHGPAIRGGPTR